ncbi:hypothetical protein GGH99_009063, partial [Coemansia sp. RSA 1285]
NNDDSQQQQHTKHTGAVPVRRRAVGAVQLEGGGSGPGGRGRRGGHGADRRHPNRAPGAA